MSTCPNCGSSIDRRDTYCPSCGIELTAGTDPRQPTDGASAQQPPNGQGRPAREHPTEHSGAGPPRQGTQPQQQTQRGAPPGGDGHRGTQPRQQPHGRGTDRRELLFAGGAVVALGVGAVLVFGDDSEEDGTTQPGGEQVASAPAASFDFDYEATSQGGRLTMTHQSGDTLQATEVFLRGDDLGQTGQWAGSTRDDGGISSGDSWQVPTDSAAYEARLVWESADGSDSAVLASQSGPDA